MIDRSDYRDEEELIAACSRRDRLAQQVLYERFSSVMYPVCLRYLGKEDAEDVLQDGFLTVFDKIGTYKGEGSFAGWMRKIFVNACLMRIRKGDVLRHTEDISVLQDPGPVLLEHGAVEQMGSKEILGLIEELPTALRTPFNLFVIEGYSHAEIGRMLGITEQSSRSQVSRARALLQEKIKKLYNDRQ